ncbi:MAG: FtsW/RodA/SpoVE family cell cycle protein, partial [Erysipelotrichaceae bacterium]|nr:FtsW/RodA/SpoVE family cell cycle protein [Erysipelotrichaceae bacterium]
MTDMRNNRFYQLPAGYDRPIHIALIALTIFGLIMSTSASMGTDAADYIGLIFTVVKQLVFVAAGYVAMLILSHIFTFKLCRKYLKEIVIFTLIALLACLVFRSVGGAKAWIRIPIGSRELTIQPSEFAKISIMVIMATFLGDIENQHVSFEELVKRPMGFVLLFVFIVVVLQSDLGSGVVMTAIAAVCFLIPKHKALSQWQYRIILMILVALALVILVLGTPIRNVLFNPDSSNYMIRRFTAAFNPFTDKYGSGFQLIKGLISFASGGLTGVGIGASIQKYTNFPAASTDYVLAIIVEETGILGFIAVFAGYMLIIMRLFNYAKKIESERAKMVLIGTAFYLFVHFVFNV